jgi:hypothetical protein
MAIFEAFYLICRPMRAGAMIVVSLAALTVPAAAAEKSADIAAYCRKNHGPTAFPNIDRRDDGLMCTIRTSGGLAQLHRKINAADVCATQHNTRRFRRDGTAVICLTGSGGNARPARTVDLAKYCRDRYGITAIVSRRLTDNKPLCTVKTDGGLAQRHHVIDLTAACGGTIGTMDGDMLKCGGTPRADTPKGISRPGPAAKPRPGEIKVAGPPPPGGAIDAAGSGRLTGTGITTAHLAGCGSWLRRRKPGEKDFSIRNPKGRGTRGWQWLGVATPCPWLKNGLVLELQKVCRAHNKRMLVWHPDGIPVCVNDARAIDHRLTAAMAGLLGTMPMTYLCRTAYYNEIGTATPTSRTNTNPDKIVSIVKYIPGRSRLECFFVKYAYLNLERIEFVSAKPPHKVLKRLKTGMRFKVRLKFLHDPRADTQPVTLRQSNGGAGVKFTARRVGRSNVFETEVVKLTEKPAP